MGKIAYFEKCPKVTPGPNSIILVAQSSFLMFPEQYGGQEGPKIGKNSCFCAKKWVLRA